MTIIGSIFFVYRKTTLAESERIHQDVPSELPPAPAVDPESIIKVLPRDSIQAIEDPQFERSEDADRHLESDERVIGVVINGDARAYPIPILSAHEIVNDVVGGEPVAITWCPLCYTALVFSREINSSEEALSFGVSGSLLHNSLVMYDRETESLWSQLYGAAIDGPLAGSSLSYFPAIHTEWELWYSQYPESQVLSKALTCAEFNCGTYSENPRGSYDVDPYESYYNTPYEGVIDHQIPREDFSIKKRVLGVRIGDHERAYPYDLLEREFIVQDEVNLIPVLVLFDASTETGLVYSRVLDGRVLNFTLDAKDHGIFRDEETKSIWQVVSGTAIGGPLKGAGLQSIFATTAFEFGWYGYFPESSTYPETQ